MNLKKKLRSEPHVHNGALNDILFILLLFFLIVSTLANPNIIKVNNARGNSDTKAKQNVTVSIDKENRVYIGQKEIQVYLLDSLVKQEVNKIKVINDTPTVAINADSLSYNGPLVKVMIAAKKAGAKAVFNVKP